MLNSMSLPPSLFSSCPYRDDRYTTNLVHVDASSGLMYPTHHRRFIFYMFTFVSSGSSNQAKVGSNHPGKGNKGGADPDVMTPLREKVWDATTVWDATVVNPAPGELLA